MDSALDIQVGGNHYKDLQMQPIVLITKANCDFIQGCIKTKMASKILRSAFIMHNLQ